MRAAGAVLHYLRFGDSGLPQEGINKFLDVAGDFKAGLQPRLLRHAGRVLTAYKDEPARGRTVVRDSLFKLLDDPERFVVAHVLLSQGPQAQTPVVEGAMWNSLRVELLPDGSTRIDPAQRVALREKWNRDLGFANGPQRLVQPTSAR